MSLKPKFVCDDELANYIMNRIEIAFSHFTWGIQSFKVSVLENMNIQLPIQTDMNGNPLVNKNTPYHSDRYVPDWNFMRTYIKAVEKKIIEDVVKYKDTIIQKHKNMLPRILWYKKEAQYA